MPNTDAVTLAAYLVLSNITKPKGCDLWVSPHGGRGDVEQLYEEDGKPYVVLSIKDLDDDALRALTLLQRDTETPRRRSVLSQRVPASRGGCLQRRPQQQCLSCV